MTYNNNTYHDAIYNAETEAEARAIALNELYKRTLEKVKAAEGMKTHRQAMEEILQEAKEEYSKAVEELAAFDPLIWEKFKHRLHTFEELKT